MRNYERVFIKKFNNTILRIDISVLFKTNGQYIIVLEFNCDI